jgi:hypothetical protein
MKTALVVALVGLAISFAVPAFAQLQIRLDPSASQIEAVTKRREEAFNKHDAAAYAAFYTEFAIDVWSWQAEGAAAGLPAIKKGMRPILHLSPHRSHSRLFRYMPSPIKYVRSWTTLITRAGRARI